MNDNEYVPATPEEAAHFEALADRFEQGWALEELQAMPMRRGRPLEVGSERAETVTVRLTPRQRRLLDAIARARHQSRSQVIRDAVDRELTLAG